MAGKCQRLLEVDILVFERVNLTLEVTWEQSRAYARYNDFVLKTRTFNTSLPSQRRSATFSTLKQT